MDLSELEWGIALLVVWLVGFAVLWVTINRQGRRGIIKSRGLIDVAMLVHIAIFLAGAALLIRGVVTLG